jgi:DNA-directed RNA polymerase specialized sigma subunit
MATKHYGSSQLGERPDNRRPRRSSNANEVQSREELERDVAITDDPVAELENRIYYKELLEALPLRLIFRGLSDYEMQLYRLRIIDEKSIDEIAAIVGKDPSRVTYDLQKIQARIRARVKQHIKKADNEMFRAWKLIRKPKKNTS